MTPSMCTVGWNRRKRPIGASITVFVCNRNRYNSYDNVGFVPGGSIFGTLCTTQDETMSKQVQLDLRKRTIMFKYCRLGTVGIFTYYENNLGRILNNITSHGSIKRNRCQPWRE
jgi:hypothetical protein